MNLNHLGNLGTVRSEVDRRHGVPSRHRERPQSSLRLIVRSMGRRRWEASHEMRPH